MIVSCACIPLWELGIFCKHTFADLLAMMPKWINMRALLQQRGDVLCALDQLFVCTQHSQPNLSHYCYPRDDFFPSLLLSLLRLCPDLSGDIINTITLSSFHIILLQSVWLSWSDKNSFIIKSRHYVSVIKSVSEKIKYYYKFTAQTH